MKTRKRTHKKAKKATLRRRMRKRRGGGLSPGDIDSPSGSAFGQGSGNT